MQHIEDRFSLRILTNKNYFLYMKYEYNIGLLLHIKEDAINQKLSPILALLRKYHRYNVEKLNQ